MKSKISTRKAFVTRNAGLLMLAALVLGTTGFVASHQSGAQTIENQAPKTSVINWQPSFEAALAQAKANGKPVMVDFGAKWCGACKMMEEQTYPDAKVIAASKNFVMAKVDVDERQDLANRYGISSLPTTVWFHADAKPIVGTVGALEAPDLVSSMNEALKRAHNSK